MNRFRAAQTVASLDCSNEQSNNRTKRLHACTYLLLRRHRQGASLLLLLLLRQEDYDPFPRTDGLVVSANDGQTWKVALAPVPSGQTENASSFVLPNRPLCPVESLSEQGAKSCMEWTCYVVRSVYRQHKKREAKKKPKKKKTRFCRVPCKFVAKGQDKSHLVVRSQHNGNK